MTRFLIESPHTSEECLDALNGILARGEEFLARFDWGCMAGDHRGWAVVEAASAREALDLVPPSVRRKARALRVTRFTREQIRALYRQT